MIRALSQTESAKNDTLLTRADGEALDALGDYYQLKRPASYPLEAWRGVLKSVVYQPRGTFRVLFSALDALFSPWRDSVQVTADINAQGQFSDASLTSTAYGHRWVKIGSDFHWVDSVDTGTTTASLSVHRSAYWSGWSEAKNAQEVSFLPFYIVESSALVEIYLDVSLLGVPPSYLQPAGATRPAGQAYGGHLLNLLDLDPDTLDYGDQTNGPFPLYLFGSETSGLLGDLLRQIVPAGIKVELKSRDWGDDLGYPVISSLVALGSI